MQQAIATTHLLCRVSKEYKLKILFCHKYHFLFGGAERYVLDLEASFHDRHLETAWFSMKHQRNQPSSFEHYFTEEIDYNVSLRGNLSHRIRLAAKLIYSFEARHNCAKLLDAWQPDIAHVHNIFHQITPSILPVLKRRGVPIVMTLHDYKLLCPVWNFLSHGEICERCASGGAYHVLLRGCTKNSRSASLVSMLEMYTQRLLGLYRNNIDLYIAPSRFMRDKMLQYGITSADRIVHVPHAIDLEDYEPRLDDDGYLLYFGRLSREKGIGTLLRALERLPGLPLRVVGEGEDAAALQAQAERAGLDVSFLGYRTGSDLRSLIAGARVTVVPSEWYETTGLVGYESLASGTPVIGSKIGGIPEVIEEGRTGLLFNPGDAEDLANKIEQLFYDEARRREMAANAAEWTARVNDRERHAEEILSVYQQAMDMKEAG